MDGVTPREALTALRTELRRSVWLLRCGLILPTLLVALAASAVINGRGIVALQPSLALAPLTILWWMRWWPIERGWREVRGAQAAQAVSVTTSAWEDPVTVTTGAGSSWRWPVIPGRSFSGKLPMPGDRAWIARPLREHAYPVIVVFDGDRPRIAVASRPAYQVPERVT